MGRRRKKTKTHASSLASNSKLLKSATVYNHETKGSVSLSSQVDDTQVNGPKSIVAKSGKVAPTVSEVIIDLRKMMLPNTASKLKEKSYNKMKDYSAVSTLLGVTHLLVVSQTENNIILKIGKTPNGPTLHFKVIKYSLARHVRNTQKRPYESQVAFMTSPLVVLNNFGQADESHIKVMKITFQNMFPSIDVNKIKLNDCRRVVLFHYNKVDGTVTMRHYAVKAQPVGISKNIKKILQSKIPNLNDLQDISEFVSGSNNATGAYSDSEAEDDEASKVVLAERYVGRGNAKNQQSAMKLIELGPRLTMDLFKVEQGINEGDILYHKYVTKTPEEALEIKLRLEKQRQLKADRKAMQEGNVKRKLDLKEKKRQEKSERKKLKLNGVPSSSAEVDDGSGSDDSEEGEDDDDDDDDEDDDEEDDDDDDDEDDEDEDGA